ncbi:MAG: tetratricopeptide repeat protein, partial [Oligoflexales bacterium]
LGEEPALVLFRGVVIGGLFLLVNQIIQKTNTKSKNSAHVISLMFLLCPVIYISMIFRFHLRPDFLCLLVFAFFILKGSQDDHNTENTKFSPPLWWYFCLFLSSQWHAGVAVYLGFVIAVLTFFSIFQKTSDFKKAKNWLHLLFCAALVAGSYLANPSHFKMISLLWVHAQYDQTLISNTEYLSFSLSFLDVTKYGWAFALWFSYLILGWFCFLYLIVSRIKNKNIYQNSYAVFTIGFVLSALSIKYIRMIPFHLIFFLPIIAQSLLHFLSVIPKARYAIWAIACFVWLVPFRSEVQKYMHLWGVSVNEQHFPVREVQFIKKIKPKGNIFSDFLPGSYQTWALQEYPVFADHRDVIYNSIKPMLVGFQTNPAITRHVEEKYGINTAFLPIATNRWDSAGNLIGGLDHIMPPKRWSMVFFSNKIAVYVRNIPEHQDIIASYQYKYLHPGYPAHVPFIKTQNQPHKEEELALEVERCLSDTPRNMYCIATQSEIFMKKDNIDMAINILEENKDIDPRKNTPILIQLWKAYTKNDQKELAAQIDQILQKRFSK